MTRYIGYVEVEPIGDLAQTAKLLGEVLGGLNFVEDHEHRFDEFPAFVATSDGIEYALLGVPDPSEDLRDVQTSNFELQVRSSGEASGEKVDIAVHLVEKMTHDGRVRGSVLGDA